MTTEFSDDDLGEVILEVAKVAATRSGKSVLKVSMRVWAAARPSTPGYENAPSARQCQSRLNARAESIRPLTWAEILELYCTEEFDRSKVLGRVNSATEAPHLTDRHVFFAARRAAVQLGRPIDVTFTPDVYSAGREAVLAHERRRRKGSGAVAELMPTHLQLARAAGGWERVVEIGSGESEIAGRASAPAPSEPEPAAAPSATDDRAAPDVDRDAGLDTPGAAESAAQTEPAKPAAGKRTGNWRAISPRGMSWPDAIELYVEQTGEYPPSDALEAFARRSGFALSTASRDEKSHRGWIEEHRERCRAEGRPVPPFYRSNQRPPEAGPPPEPIVDVREAPARRAPRGHWKNMDNLVAAYATFDTHPDVKASTPRTIWSYRQLRLAHPELGLPPHSKFREPFSWNKVEAEYKRRRRGGK